MSLWVDKYRPLSFEKITFHKNEAEQLKNLISCGDFPHLLFHGPSGSGKRTRVMCLLREFYGQGVERTKIQTKSLTINNQPFEVNLLTSNYHLELNPSDSGKKDRIVIQALLKEIASTQQLNSENQKSFKVVVIHECESMTKNAQNALRRTMEKYVKTCRLILISNSLSQIITPIKSRCLHIRVGAPSLKEVKEAILDVCLQEKIGSPFFADKIAVSSNRNVRKALLCLEACRVEKYPFEENQSVTISDWETYIKDTAVKILSEQTPKILLEVRSRLYELLIHCIPSTIIIKTLLKHLLEVLNDSLKCEILHWASIYEHRIKIGSKEIYHLEAFVAKFMCIYKKYLIGLYE